MMNYGIQKVENGYILIEDDGRVGNLRKWIASKLEDISPLLISLESQKTKEETK